MYDELCAENRQGHRVASQAASMATVSNTTVLACLPLRETASGRGGTKRRQDRNKVKLDTISKEA